MPYDSGPEDEGRDASERREALLREIGALLDEPDTAAPPSAAPAALDANAAARLRSVERAVGDLQAELSRLRMTPAPVAAAAPWAAERETAETRIATLLRHVGQRFDTASSEQAARVAHLEAELGTLRRRCRQAGLVLAALLAAGALLLAAETEVLSDLGRAAQAAMHLPGRTRRHAASGRAGRHHGFALTGAPAVSAPRDLGPRPRAPRGSRCRASARSPARPSR